MTDTPQPAPAGAPETGGSFFSNLLDVFVEPKSAFERIAARPSPLIPVAGYTAVSLAFFAIWLQKMDARVFFRNMLAQNPRTAEMPAEQVNQIIDMQSRGIATWGWASSGLSPVIVTLVLAAIFLFVFRFFAAADVSFRQSWAVVGWSFFAVALVSSPLILAVMSLKEDFNMNPQDALQANATALLEPGSLPPWAWTLVSSFDLLSFWTIFLLATGFGAAMKARSLSAPLWTVGSLWAVYVVCRVGWNLIF
jgi:hypothetical protein